MHLPFHDQSEMQTSSFPLPPALVSSSPPAALSLAVFSVPYEPFSSLSSWIQFLLLAAQGPRVA